MASFLDFVSDVFDGDSVWGKIAQTAIPAVATSLLVKKPKIADSSSAISLDMYKRMADLAEKQGALTDIQKQVLLQHYLPMAIGNANRAQSVGSGADLETYIGRAGADADQANANVLANYDRQYASTGGRKTDPSYLATRALIESKAVPNKIHAMNTAGMQREEYGDRLRASALGGLQTNPNYLAGAGTLGGAAGGIGGVGSVAMQNYRQEVADTMAAFKEPWQIAAADRQKTQDRQDESAWRDAMIKAVSGRGYS